MSRDQTVAIDAARTVLRDAVTYHERFGGGFRFHGSGSTFSVTADSYAALLTNFRSLSFDADAAMRDDAFAAYDQRRDTVELRRENFSHPAFRNAMLHELVHAYQDFAHFRGRHWEVEATAYMAQALWSAADGSRGSRSIRHRLEQQTRPAHSTPNTPIFVEAARACITLGLDQRVATIDRRHIAPLEQALRASPAYAHVVDSPFTGDGIVPR